MNTECSDLNNSRRKYWLARVYTVLAGLPFPRPTIGPVWVLDEGLSSDPLDHCRSDESAAKKEKGLVDWRKKVLDCRIVVRQRDNLAP